MLQSLLFPASFTRVLLTPLGVVVLLSLLVGPVFAGGPCTAPLIDCETPPVVQPPTAPPVTLDPAPGALPEALGGGEVVYGRFYAGTGPEVFVKAEGRLGNGYVRIGVAGPCFPGETCPNLEAQAYQNLQLLLLNDNRAQRAVAP